MVIQPYKGGIPIKKKYLLILLLLPFIIITACNSEDKEKEDHSKRYEEIKKDFEEGLLWSLNANYPNGCLEVKDGVRGRYDSAFLINQGYIKKEIMLDVDGISYCTAYADTSCTTIGELPEYKIYLKCKDYVDKGHAGW